MAVTPIKPNEIPCGSDPLRDKWGVPAEQPDPRIGLLVQAGVAPDIIAKLIEAPEPDERIRKDQWWRSLSPENQQLIIADAYELRHPRPF